METRAEREQAARQVFHKAAALVARKRRLRVGEVLAPRGAAQREARQLATYLAVVAGNAPAKRVARVAGVNQFTVQFGLRRVEDRRDDPRFDGWLSKLEGQLHA